MDKSKKGPKDKKATVKDLTPKDEQGVKGGMDPVNARKLR